MIVTVQLLGGASLRSGDTPLSGPPAQRHRIALLAMIVAAWPQPLSRDRAMALLWPERDAANARRLLNLAVHVLRSALGDGVIASTGDGLLLVPALVRCDLHDLRAVLKAMDALLPSEPGWSLDAPDMLKRLYLAGRASFGRIVTLVQRACLHALMTGADRVGPVHYSAAWLEVAPRRQRSDKHDPFKLDIATVTTLAAQLCAKLRERE